MSYDVYLEDHTAALVCNHQPDWYELVDVCPQPCYPAVTVERHSEGGTYALGGTEKAELNVTYNYGKHIWPYMEGGLKWLDGRRAAATIGRLEGAVNALGLVRSDDYWEATPGNAGYALNILLGWARQHPDAIWSVH